MEQIYCELGQEIRRILLINGFDINRAVEVDSDNNTTIFNMSDTSGIVISQKYISYNSELYNERVSNKIEVYKGGLCFSFPKINFFCKCTDGSNVSVPFDEDNYLVIHNPVNKESYSKLASKKTVIFIEYSKIKEKSRNMIDKTTDYMIGYNSYTHIDEYVEKNGDIYHLSIFLPRGRIKTEDNGRTK